MFVTDVFKLDPIKPDPEKNEINIKDAPQGTFYENRNGEISLIKKDEKGMYKIYHQEKMLDVEFPTFEEAEKYVKRNFQSWLQYDRNLNKLKKN